MAGNIIEGKLSRREFLKLAAASAGAVVGGSILSACGRNLSSTPTEQIKPIEPVKTYTPEPTRHPTPRPLELIEQIDCGIPGIRIEKYRAEFTDITDEVNPSYKQRVEEWLNRPDLEPRTPHEICSSDNSWISFLEGIPLYREMTVLSIDKIRNKNDDIYFYHNGRFYTDIPAYFEQHREKLSSYISLGYYPLGNDDLEVLGWSSGFVRKVVDITSKGQILYTVSDSWDDKYDQNTHQQYALILADIPNRTKTIIRNNQSQIVETSISPDGESIFLYFGKVALEGEALRKGNKKYIINERDYDPVLINPDSGRVIFRFQERPDWMSVKISDDNNRLWIELFEYVYTKENKRPYIDYFLDIKTGKKTPIFWPYNLSYHSGYIISPNLDFISRNEGSPARDCGTGGCWDAWWDPLIYTPTGYISIGNYNLIRAWRISNKGTIYSEDGDVFQYIDGSYRTVRISDYTKGINENGNNGIFKGVVIEEIGEDGLPIK